MSPNCSFSGLWSMLESAMSMITRHDTSAKIPLTTEVLHMRRGACAIIIAMIGLLAGADAALGAAASIVLIHPFNLVFSLFCVMVTLPLFSISVRPPYAERNSGESAPYLFSPISVTYLLLAFPMSISAIVPDQHVSVRLLSFVVSTILVMSLLSFEREQVRLSLDDSTRHKAILLNGTLVSDGIPRGYASSVVSLIIIAMAATPEFLAKTWSKLSAAAEAESGNVNPE